MTKFLKKSYIAFQIVDARTIVHSSHSDSESSNRTCRHIEDIFLKVRPYHLHADYSNHILLQIAAEIKKVRTSHQYSIFPNHTDRHIPDVR